MSTATDLAELDAAIAENDLTDEEAGLVRELVVEGKPIAEALEVIEREREQAAPPPPQPEPAEDDPGEPSDKQLRELDREQTRHLDKARTIMGPFLEGFAECEKCGGLGLTPPGPAPKGHEFFIACPTCNGFGEVYTGSLRPGRESTDCPACGGTGYLEQLDSTGAPLSQASPSAQAPQELPAPAPTELSPTEPPAQTTEPRYGRPAWMGDPNIGT